MTRFSQKTYDRAIERARGRALDAAVILNIAEGYAEAMPHNRITLGVPPPPRREGQAVSLLAWIRQRRLARIVGILAQRERPEKPTPHDRAFSVPSLAQVPGVRVVRGHQAFCLVRDAHHWTPEERIPLSGHGHATWIGPWRESAFEARLDALEHNLALGHPVVQPWPLD